jgi:hypothetical protein
MIVEVLPERAGAQFLPLDSIDQLSIAVRRGFELAYIADKDRGNNFFKWHPESDNLIVDNGIIYAAQDGGYWERLYTGSIHLKWFAVDPTGLADSTSGVQNFMTAILSSRFTYSIRGRAKGIIDKGFYRITDQINISSCYGVTIEGEGVDASIFFLENVNKVAFKVTRYIGLKFADLTFLTGNLSYSAGIPQVSPKAVADRNNIAFSFSTSDGGTRCFFENVEARGFDIVMDTTTSMRNGDFHNHINCSFHRNNKVWNNTNVQAVIWRFDNCQMHFNEYCFYNPGVKTLVTGGDYINPGTFLFGDTIHMVTGFMAIGVKFENFQNIDDTKNPKWIDISGDYQNVEFLNCSSRTGSFNLSGKVAFTISQNSSIYFRNCYLDGEMDIHSNGIINGVTGKVVFDNCDRLPPINQTLSSAGAFAPFNIQLINQKSSGNARYNRNYIGFHNTSEIQNGIGIYPSNDVFGWETLINNQTRSIKAKINTLQYYPFFIRKITICCDIQTTQTLTFTLWKDDTKTDKILEFDSVSSGALAKEIYEKGLSDFLINPVIEHDSEPLFLEYGSTGNCGLTSAKVYIELIQASDAIS